MGDGYRTSGTDISRTLPADRHTGDRVVPICIELRTFIDGTWAYAPATTGLMQVSLFNCGVEQNDVS